MWIIYKATSPTGKCYIGYTCNLYNRKKDHKCQAFTKKSNCSFQRALRKYWDEMIWEIIDQADSKERIQELEKFYIRKFDSYKNGYNCSLGGDGFAGTEEVKKKISNTLKHKYHKNPNTRLKHSRERGGKSILVFNAILIQKACGRPNPREAIYSKGVFVGKFETQVEACEKLNLSRAHVNQCLFGKRRTHKNYLFEYVENT